MNFIRFSNAVSHAAGHQWTFIIAVLCIVAWAVTGPMFNFSETWQLVINTGTTIVTFLMVFLIQNTQNRDGRAVQVKLDELIKTNKEANNKLIRIEDQAEEDIEAIRCDK